MSETLTWMRLFLKAHLLIFSIETDKFKAHVSNDLEQTEPKDIFLLIKNKIENLLVN